MSPQGRAKWGACKQARLYDIDEAGRYDTQNKGVKDIDIKSSKICWYNTRKNICEKD
jgi:hypothetical protein